MCWTEIVIMLLWPICPDISTTPTEMLSLTYENTIHYVLPNIVPTLRFYSMAEVLLVSLEKSAIAIVESCFRCLILLVFKPEVYRDPLLLEARHISWRLLLQKAGIDNLTFLSIPIKISLDRNILFNLSRLFTFDKYHNLNDAWYLLVSEEIDWAEDLQNLSKHWLTPLGWVINLVGYKKEWIWSALVHVPFKSRVYFWDFAMAMVWGFFPSGFRI